MILNPAVRRCSSVSRVPESLISEPMDPQPVSSRTDRRLMTESIDFIGLDSLE